MVLTEKKICTNWSGDIRFSPAKIVVPENEEQLRQVVQEAIANKLTIRTIGARHSCSPIFETDQILVSMENFKGLYEYDAEQRTAVIGAGTTVEEAGEELFRVGLALENTGHINKQALAGAISTGTHGAGKELKNLSGQVTGIRLINGSGDIKEFDEEHNGELMQALKVSLGSLGIFTRLKLRVLPRFTLHRRQYCAHTDDCLANLKQLMEENRNFCFYWYPRRDDVSIKLWNAPGEGTAELPYATLYKEYSGWSKDVLPTTQRLKFNELEYSFDHETAPHCFQEIRQRIKAKHRKHLAWRVLYRPVAADTVFLSNAYNRNIVAITIHQHASLPYEDYFNDIEKIFQSYGGRPHWGKKHSLKAPQLQQLYPEWNRFQQIRKRFDPNGIFLNDYLKNVFIG
ncbi:D-arabinono-1,4-lactone oxidase [Longitalea luteola]|uniref:D-arabinono-1,4-lactone oxidase n=1 Tax=Longitalea luteola TaxID=2812563 RepID=UPI001A960A99|nr:D-arabinono-1,4-lactone oxidase [Longitalea luteola]